MAISGKPLKNRAAQISHDCRLGRHPFCRCPQITKKRPVFFRIAQRDQLQETQSHAADHHVPFNGFDGLTNTLSILAAGDLLDRLGLARFPVTIQAWHRPAPEMIGKRAQRLFQDPEGRFRRKAPGIEPDDRFRSQLPIGADQNRASAVPTNEDKSQLLVRVLSPEQIPTIIGHGFFDRKGPEQPFEELSPRIE